MRTSRKKRRFGTLLFFIPIVIIGGVIIYGFVQIEFFSSGTLAVSALSYGKYSPQAPLHVKATVNGVTTTTPFNMTLRQGPYTVTFASLQWYKPALPLTRQVRSGGTTFAIGVYVPALAPIAVSPTSFNATSVQVEHGVTPVAWMNTSDQNVLIQGGEPLQILIPPHMNFTEVFQQPGTYVYAISGSQGQTLQIVVV